MRIRGNTARIAVAAGLALAATAGVSGCSTEAPVTPAPAFTSHEQVIETMAACLRARGWDARIIDGTVQTDYPTEQESAFQADARACEQELGLPDDPTPTESQLRELYDGIVEGGRCLEEHGYIADYEPPSFETFRSRYDEGALDHPWDAVPAHETGNAFHDCPPPRIL